MRRFSLGSASSRKVVVVAVEGTSLSVTKIKPDGQSDRQIRTLGSEAEARRASEQLVKELLSRGYVEHAPSGEKPARKAAVASPARTRDGGRPARKVQPEEEDDPSPLYALMEETAAEPQPMLPRLQPAPAPAAAVEAAPKPKKKKKKKGKKQDDGLDKRVLAAVAGVGLVLLGGLCYIVYDGFIKPPSIVGVWRGSNTEYEIGSLIQFSEYELILDGKKRASMTSAGGDSSTGTYSVKGDRLKLNLKDDEGEASEREYRIVLGRATLDLKEPETGKLVVQLIRFREEPSVGQKKGKRAEAPKDVAVGEADKGDDSALVTQDFSPKDNAFKLRPPKGWESDTGSRPDNTYSWAKFTRDSAVVQIYADVAGSLMSGSDSSRDHEEGSESAPVHVAHELYGKTGAKDEFSDFADSKPAVFKDSGMGEGRISIFTASTGGLLSSKLRGYHVTLLSRDRRVTALCYCPEKEFPGLKPLFLSVCRSFKR